MRHAARLAHWLALVLAHARGEGQAGGALSHEPERQEDATERDRAADAGKERR